MEKSKRVEKLKVITKTKGYIWKSQRRNKSL